MNYFSNQQANLSSTGQQSGYMLLEILITIAILGVGLLGIAALQMNSLKTSQSAIQRGEAAIRIAEMSNRMRANASGVSGGFYHRSAYTKATDSSTQPSNEEGRAIRDFNDWLTEVQISHGEEAEVSINCSGAGVQCILGVRWDDQRGNADVNLRTAVATNDTSERFTYVSDVVF